MDAVVFYKISNPKYAVCSVENADNATQLLAQTSLRNCLGTRNLQEILQQRDDLSRELQHIIDPPTDKWGVKVSNRLSYFFGYFIAFIIMINYVLGNS